MKKKNISQKFFQLKNEIYKQIGDGVRHEVHGNFKYYTSGNDYVVVENLKKNQSIQVASDVEVTFDIENGVPSEKQLLAWYRQALETAKKGMKNNTIQILEERKAKVLEEARNIRKELKEAKAL